MLNSPVARVQSLVLALLPQGGQLAARRNAWSGMASDATRARAWREASAAVTAAAVAGRTSAVAR